MAKNQARRKTARQLQAAKRRQQEQQNRYIAIGAAIVLVIVIFIVAVQVVSSPGDEELAADCPTAEAIAARPLAALSPAARQNYFTEAPPQCLETGVDYGAVILTENGEVSLDLYETAAPITVNSFVFLARQGFYDGVVFHRVLDGFMAQGGDPTGTGGGGPGYAFADETNNGLGFDRPGLLAMANAGANTNGSQFFITYGVPDWLNGNHTIFGELQSGGDVLNNLTLRDPDRLAPGAGPGDVILRIDITES